MNAHKTSVISGRVLGGNRLLARCDRLPYVFGAAIRCEHTTARQRLECARFIAAFAPHCLTHSPASTPRHSAVKSGAEATALQTLTRLPGILEIREASGVRPVYRRFVPGSTTK